MKLGGFIGSIEINNNDFINLNIDSDSSVLSSAVSITGIQNLYIAKIDESNYMDDYVASKGFSDFESYLSSTLKRLQQNPHSYFDVTEVLQFIRAKSSATKLKY
jgi:hypothetical protein